MHYRLMRGDTLSQGRYRILNQIALPEPQQRQAVAWEAIDLQVSQRHVVIRQFVVPQAIAATSSAEQVASEIAQRLHELGQHEGFPKVISFDPRCHMQAEKYPHQDTMLQSSCVAR